MSRLRIGFAVVALLIGVLATSAAAGADGTLTLTSPLNDATMFWRTGDQISIPMTVRFNGFCGPPEAPFIPDAAAIYMTAGDTHPIWAGGYADLRNNPAQIGWVELNGGVGTYTFSDIATGNSAPGPFYWTGFFAAVGCDDPFLALTSNSVDQHIVAPCGRVTWHRGHWSVDGADDVDELGEGQTITTEEHTRLEIRLPDRSIIRIGPLSKVQLTGWACTKTEEDRKVDPKLVVGDIWAHIIGGGQKFDTSTETGGGVRGTTIELAVHHGTTKMRLDEGHGYIFNRRFKRKGRVNLRPGTCSTVRVGSRPKLPWPCRRLQRPGPGTESVHESFAFGGLSLSPDDELFHAPSPPRDCRRPSDRLTVRSGCWQLFIARRDIGRRPCDSSAHRGYGAHKRLPKRSASFRNISPARPRS